MKKIFTTLVVFITLSCYCFSQEPEEEYNQVVKGRILDKDSKTPLWGATLVVVGSKPLMGCTTDSSGYFKLPSVPVGRQVFKITYLGYEDVLLQNVLVSSGQDVFLNIMMKESFNKIKEVEVEAKFDKDKALNPMATISARTFSIEETNRFAGGLTDPSRMAQAFAGVSSTSGSNNEIVVRGNSPRGLLWRIEGIEILNPNHFREDEGASGGGVCILSSNMISNSDFFTSAFPAEYGNALSGVFDLNLRKGSDEYFHAFVQASVVGTEVALEGPISKKKESSYLVNYRYSTFSMLDKIGIKVSKENIVPVFQDLAFNLSFPSDYYGHTTLFGIFGASSSGIKAIRDSVNLTEKENRYEELDKGNIWITGITNQYLLPNKKTFLKTVVAVMGEDNKMSNDTMDYKFQDHNIYKEDLTYRTLRGSVLLNHKYNAKHTIRSGIIFSREEYNLYSSGLDFETGTYRTVFDNKGFTYVLQGYMQWKFRATEKLDINTGVHYLHFLLNNNNSVEPRMGIVYQIDGRQSFSAGAGLHSRLEPISIYMTQIPQGDGTVNQQNKKLDISKSLHTVLGYDISFTEDLHLKAEIYYQYLYDIPIEKSPDSQFSVLNVKQGFVMAPMDNNGEGQNYGIDLTFERYFTKKYYYMITGSLYDSKYSAGDGKEYNTMFNGNYIFNLLGGKEWAVGKKKNNLLGVNARILYKGGMRYQKIDLDKSRISGSAVYIPGGNFTNRFADYYNIDVGVNFKRNHEKFSWILSLDVQNLTSRENVISVKYNRYTGNLKYEYDLLLLPLLSYRLNF
ncbi:MAG: TonB-dependent receptor [Bacteroidia bacterium]|nr:TonB-dependent receptor [Bacteroidia bacterium]